MDQQAATLLATLKRPAVASDAKLTAFNALKSDIKHYRVPENAQVTIFECIKLGITQQASSSLAGSAFSTLGHLIKRLKIQDPNGVAITHLCPRLYGAITERLGDLREQIRTTASNAFAEMWPFLAQDVERIIREDVMGSTNVRAKESGMAWVARMHRDEQMPFKSFVSPMVACLEDADGTVRDAARNALVELFKDAPDRAKTDLKRQLKAHSVRHAIESQILSQIGPVAQASVPEAKLSPEHEHAPQQSRPLPSQNRAAHLVKSIESEAAQPPPQEVVPMDPQYVHSERELNDIFRDMTPFFEGRETEQNWGPRDKSVIKIRRLLKGNAPSDYHQLFMTSVKALMEGILKVANSLRTTTSTNGCQLVQELAQTLGPAIDSQVEILLQTFVKMSSATKHIASENGRATCNAVFQHCSYHVRLMQHIWAAAQDKNVQTRQCVPMWLNTILDRQAGYKSHFDSSGGLDLAEKCIKKGLDDANPKVKEAMRATYWTFAQTWPDKAEAIMSKLDPKSKSMLEKDSNNPNAALFQSQMSTGSRPAIVGRPSALKELMAEQRRAKSVSRNMQERPNSAMATMTPARSRPEARSTQRAASKSRTRNQSQSRAAATNAAAANSTTAKGSSLMSGPVRRPRRQEIQRPLTADPYASRRMIRPETPVNHSPGNSPQKNTSASRSSIPTSSANRTRPGAGVRSRETSPTVARRVPPAISSRLNDSSRPGSRDSTNSFHTAEASSHLEDEHQVRHKDAHVLRRPQSMQIHSPSLRPTSSDGGLLPPMEEEDLVPSAGKSSHRRQLSQTLSSRSQSPEVVRSPLKAMIDAAREKLDRSPSSTASNHIHSDVLSHPTNGTTHTPIKPVSPQRQVKVYEDPVTEQAIAPTQTSQQQVLSEKTANENITLQSPAQSNGSTGSPAGSPPPLNNISSIHQALSPGNDRTELLRNRRLLSSGIERIKGCTLDAHGFRRVQDLAKSTGDIWDGGAKFDELMTALLAYLTAFGQDARLSNLTPLKMHGLKVQALAVLRALLTVHPKLAKPWYHRSLVTVFACRTQVDDSNDHIVADLEKTAEEIIRLAPSTSCIDSAVEYLNTLSKDPTEAPGKSASAAMALFYLRLLVISISTREKHFDEARRAAIAKVAAAYIEHSEAEVRKYDVDLASEIYQLYGDKAAATESSKEEFWQHFVDVDEGRKGLLTYYIARKAKA